MHAAVQFANYVTSGKSHSTRRCANIVSDDELGRASQFLKMESAPNRDHDSESSCTNAIQQNPASARPEHQNPPSRPGLVTIKRMPGPLPNPDSLIPNTRLPNTKNKDTKNQNTKNQNTINPNTIRYNGDDLLIPKRLRFMGLQRRVARRVAGPAATVGPDRTSHQRLYQNKSIHGQKA